MGFCVYFHRTWTPGYNSEIIDPNLAYSYQKKLDCLKKLAWWVFIMTLIVCIVILLAKLVIVSSGQSGESRCPDRSDQLGCSCQPDSFVCNARSSPTRECIHKYLVCDSVRDCSNGFDEAFCLAVSPSLTNLNMDRSNRTLEGYVLVQVKGSWHPYCSDSWSAEMGEKICRFLGYNNLLNLDDIELDNLENSQKQNESAENDNHDNLLLLLLKDNSRFDTGPIEDVVTKINTDSYSCNVALIKCSKR